MADTTFVQGTIVPKEWLNDVNDLRYGASSSSQGAALLQFMAASGTTVRTAQAKMQDVIAVEDFGASVGGTAAANVTGIQAAIDAAETNGGGRVKLKAGRYSINSTLTLPNKVILSGEGSGATEIYLANSSNCTMIKSDNYDTLVGTDTWLVASGCTYAFGLEHLKLNGNYANQSSGSGVQFYGKRLYVNDVMIVYCKDEGWHSESNATIPGSPDTDGDDMPEGLINGLYVWQNGSHGMMFRGQHDSLIGSLFAGLNGGWGVRFETDTSAPTVYSGNCDSKFMHVYANVSGGVYIDVNASHQCSFMICENNDGVGLQCDGWQVKIGQLQLYSNNRVTGDYQAIITGNECVFGKIHSKLAKSAKAHVSVTGDKTIADIMVIGASTDGASGSVGGVSITGANNKIHVHADGNTSAGIGLDVDDNGNNITFHIQDYSAAGGIGLRTNNGGAKIGNHFKGYLLNNKTLWNHVTGGTGSSYNIHGFANAGQTVFSGAGPNTTDTNEFWNVSLYDTDTTTWNTSQIRKLSGDIDLNVTTEQTITITYSEMLGLTPEPEDIQATLYYNGTNTAFAVQYIKLYSISAGTITFHVKLSTAAGGAATAKLAIQVRL